MSYSRFSLSNAGPSYPYRMRFARPLTIVFCCFFIACLLAACGGSTATSHQSTPPLTPTATFTLTPTNTPTPTLRPTSTPTPRPRAPTPLPATQPAPPVPAPILDVAPSSMSIVGHLDCRRTSSVFVCQAGVFSRASNQAVLHWVAFSNIAGVSFTPAQGSLASNSRVILTIRIPVNACSGTFFFQGPVNTHTIIWQC